MKRSTVIWILIIIIVIIAVFWYWGSMTPQSPSVTSTSTLGETSTTAPSLTVVDLNTASTGTLGTYLTAENGMTLYQYSKDMPGVSDCTGQCAVTWLPYAIPLGETSSTLTVGAGVPGQIGVITRTDGTEQITYNNIPLYYYSKDQAVGDTNGENVGGVWYVIPPSTASSSSIPAE